MNEQTFTSLEDMLNYSQNNSYNNTDNSRSNSKTNFDFSNIDMETIFRIKNIMNQMNSPENNSRSNLLRSLEPYLNPSRKEKLDQYIQFINIASILENFNKAGDK